MGRSRTSVILSALLVISWLAFAANSPRAEERTNLNDKWHYKTAGQAELFEAGENGWEAYAVIRLPGDTQPTYHLKRRAN